LSRKEEGKNGRKSDICMGKQIREKAWEKGCTIFEKVAKY
jgi:hypothetical protein